MVCFVRCKRQSATQQTVLKPWVNMYAHLMWSAVAAEGVFWTQSTMPQQAAATASAPVCLGLVLVVHEASWMAAL